MNISNTGGLDGAQPVRPVRSPQSVQKAYTPPAATPAAADSAEISVHAQMLQKLHALPDLRQDKIAELEQLIGGGQYETEDKIRSAVEKLIDESL